MTPLVEQLTTLTYYRGRVALSALLSGLGVRPGDAVATQAFTCVAVPEAIKAVGARPLWIDIEPRGVNMDPDALAQSLRSSPKAIIVQHTFGIPANMGPILAVADAQGIPVVEDCCHALVSSVDGRRVGEMGVGAFYSFEWGKPIVAGVGGAAVARDPSLRARVTSGYESYEAPPFLRVAKTQAQYAAFSLLFRPSLYWRARSAFHALSSIGVAEGNYNALGGDRSPDFKLRMAVSLRRRLVRKLERLDRVTAHAQAVSERLAEGVDTPLVERPGIPHGADVVYARYPLFTEHKEAILDDARAANVELADWYRTPVHPLRPSELGQVDYRIGECSEAERAAARIVSLPTHPKVSWRNVEGAITMLNGFRP